MDDFTPEEKREIKQLLNIVRYAKPKRMNEAEKKLSNIINKRIEDAIEKGFNLGDVLKDLANRKGKW